MKRNESALVYAVTGLLLVILSVAVLFGEEPARADEKPAVPAVQLPNVADSLLGNAGEPEGGKPAVAPGTAADDDGPGVVPDVTGGTGADPSSAMPLRAERPLDTPERRLETMLGANRTMGNYRVVPARSGETLADVAARWCGDPRHLAEIETLNESLTGATLKAGQEVIVPWIDAETLLASASTRRSEAAKVERAKGELYTLQRGDSLWKIARGRNVPTNQVPAWLQRFRQINPSVSDVGLLVEGQKVRLPD